MAALKFTSSSGWEMEPVADEVSLCWWSSKDPISTTMALAGGGGMAAARCWGLVVLGAEEGVVGTAPADPAGTALLPVGGRMAPAGAPVAAGSALMLLLLLLKLLELVSIFVLLLLLVAATASGRRGPKARKRAKHLGRACVRVCGV